MATFDPDAFLAKTRTTAIEPTAFDPDAFLAKAKPVVAPPQPSLEAAVMPKPAAPAVVEGAGGAAFGLYPKPKSAPAKIEEKVVKPVAPTPVLDFSEFDKALETLTPKAKGPSVTKPVEGAGGAAFGVYPKQPMGGRTEGLSVETASKSAPLLSVAATYLAERQPNKPLPNDPIKIMETFRSSFVRGDIATVDELTWALNARPEQKQIAAKAYELSSKLGTPFGEELRATFNPIESPLTYASGGVGWGVKQAALRGTATAAKMLIKAGPSAVTAGVEAGVAAGTNVVQQKTMVELGLQEEFSYSQLALTAGIAGVATKVLTTGMGDKLKTTEQRMLDLEKARLKPMDEVDKISAAWVEKFKNRETAVKKELAALFGTAEEKAAARETMDTLSPQTDTTKAVLNDKVIADIYSVTKQLFKDNPDLRPDLNETRITQGMINALDKASPEMIKDAASKAGISPADFLATFKVSVSDAGVVMQKSKAMADYVKKLTGGDPELEKTVDSLYRSTEGVQYWTHKAITATSKVSGASVAASVLAPATTVLNAFSVAFSLSLQTAGDIGTALVSDIPTKLAKGMKNKGVPVVDALDILEETVATTGRAVNDLGGKIVPLPQNRIKQDVGQSLADSMSLVTKLIDGGFTADMSDLMLKNNPKLSNMLTHVGTEADMTGASKMLKVLNAPAMVLDAVTRGPVFVDSVSRRMKDIGLDYLDFAANKRPIPQAILEAAADDAMKLTFSYEFKPMLKLGEKSLEAGIEHGAFLILDATRKSEMFKIGKDIAFPFLRYTMNAVRHSYRLTPFSGGAGVLELRAAAKLRDEGKLIEASRVSFDGKRKVVDSMVGGALIIATSYDQDDSLPFWQKRDQDGNAKDWSNIAPMVQVFALAAAAKLMKDLSKSLWYTLKYTPEERSKEAEIIKKKIDEMPMGTEGRQNLVNDYELMKGNRLRNFDGGKFGEIMAGWGRASGIQKTMIDTFKEAVESGISESEQRNAGGVGGDFVGRFDNVLNPLWEAFSAFNNDMRIIDVKEPTKMDEQLGEFGAGFVAPVASQLPGVRSMYAAKPSLFHKGEQRVPTVTRQMLGIKPEMPTSKIENELLRLGVQPFSVYKSSGDRGFDNMHIRLVGSLVRGKAEEAMNNALYKRSTMNQQKEQLETAIQNELSETKGIVQDIYMQKNTDKAVDNLYKRVPKTRRESAEDAFIDRFKRRPETAKEKLLIIEGEFSFAKGGFVSKRP